MRARLRRAQRRRALLAERPRRDLNALLSDREALAAMPVGSFADAYLRYLGGEDMGSAQYFLEAADLDEKARRFGWNEDQLWFVKRMANSHDLFHVITGYDRDVQGEVGIVAYTTGQIPLLPLRLLLAYLLVLKPPSRSPGRASCGDRIVTAAPPLRWPAWRTRICFRSRSMKCAARSVSARSPRPTRAACPTRAGC